MSLNINVLNSLKEKVSQSSDLQLFDDLICVSLGIEVKEYFASVKDEHGKVLKDVNGKTIKSTEASGYVYTFVDLFKQRFIKFVLKDKIEFDALKIFSIKGNGYDMVRNSNMIYLIENVVFEEVNLGQNHG